MKKNSGGALMTLAAKSKTSYAAPAVDRTLEIIEHMADNKGPRGISELSRALKINNNSIFRILNRMAERGYVESDPASGKYQLSAKFFSLGMRLYSRFELRQRARKHLESLSSATGETAQIQIPSGKDMLALDVVPPAEASYFLQIVPGSKVNYHCNAFGKCVMAFMSKEEVSAILPKKLEALTKNSITSRDVFLEHIEKVRKTGVAFDMQEYIEGIFCVGSPVLDAGGKAVAGLGITGLISRYSKSGNRDAIRLTLETAGRLSEDIGHRGDYFTKALENIKS
jgi:DNA-binding IclR family transcriptional regulator